MGEVLEKSAMTGDDAKRILIEMTAGQPPPPEEDPESAEYRRNIQRQVDDILRDGGFVEIPGDIA
jgi:hypothetical protein